MNIQSLFPSAILRSELDREFYQEELEFIHNLDRDKNQINYISREKYILDNNLSKLKSFIMNYVNHYVHNILCYSDEVQPYITQSWVNYTKEGEYHHKHHHDNSFLSGVLYISADIESDKIFFHRKNEFVLKVNSVEYNEYNSPTWFYPVKSGDIIIFPSYLTHSVGLKKDDKERCSLAFNVFLKGKLGNFHGCTELVVNGKK